jgi:thiol-disulfide isomerase/thioredoxin
VRPAPGSAVPGTRRRRAVAGLLVTWLALAACSSASGSGNGYVSGDGTVTTFPAADRKSAPAVSGPTLEGGQLSLSSYRGKVVVLNFWGSWCPPCRAEGPFLQFMSTQYAPKGVQFVGVDIRDDADSARAFLQNIDASYPNLFDGPDGLLVLRFSDVVPPQATPSTLVIDRKGRIAVRILGPTTEPALAAILAPLIAEKA